MSAELEVPPVREAATLRESERQLRAYDFQDNNQLREARSADTAQRHLPGLSILRTDTNTETRRDGSKVVELVADGHKISYQRSDTGSLLAVTAGRAEWKLERGVWKGPFGQTADSVEVTGTGRDTRVVIRQGDKTTTIRADGSSSEETDGPNGSEHIVIRNSKAEITKVVHNGHEFAVKDGKVASGMLRGAKVNEKGEIESIDGRLKLKENGTTEITNGNMTTIGFGDGSRIYKRDGAVIAVRDANRNVISYDNPDSKATIAGGRDHPLKDKKVELKDEGSARPYLIEKGNPNTRYYLDGTREKIEGGRTTEVTDAQGKNIAISYGRDGRIQSVASERYGNITVGAGPKDAKEIAHDSKTGTLTATMNDGSRVVLNPAERSKTTIKDGVETKDFLSANYTEIRRGGKLSEIVQNGLRWNVTEGRDGRIESIKSPTGRFNFKVGEKGVTDIKIKDGVITVSKQDRSTATFRPDHTAELNIPGAPGRPARTVRLKLDTEGRPVEVRDGSTSNGGRENVYHIAWGRDGHPSEIKVNGRRVHAAPGERLRLPAVLEEREAGREPGRVTEGVNSRKVEKPHATIVYQLNGDRVPTSAAVFKPGADKPTFTVTFGEDGRTVTEVRDRAGRVIGRARPGVAISLDDNGILTASISDSRGRPKAEIALAPDGRRGVKVGDDLKVYSPERFPLRFGSRGALRAAFDYHTTARNELATDSIPKPGNRTETMAIPSRARYRNGTVLERVGGDDVTNPDPTARTRFVLSTRDGRPIREFERAAVDRSGVTWAKDRTGWHKISPDGAISRVLPHRATDDRTPSDRTPADRPRPGRGGRPWLESELAGAKVHPNRRDILYKHDEVTGKTTYFDTTHNVKSVVTRDDRGHARTLEQTRLNATTGRLEREAWTRVEPGSPLQFPFNRFRATADTWRSSEQVRYHVGGGRYVTGPKYGHGFNLDTARPRARREMVV